MFIITSAYTSHSERKYKRRKLHILGEWSRESGREKNPRRRLKQEKTNKQKELTKKTISNYLLLRTFFWLQIYVVEGFPDRK